MSSSNIFLVSILVICSSIQIASSQVVEGWDCFKCSSTTDDLCITKPESISSGDVFVRNCTGFCTTVRTEFTDIPGQVISLVRDCEKSPLVRNAIITDAHYTKYHRSCTTNKCNGGDGIIGSGQNGNNPSELITVPEKRSSGCKTLISGLLLLFTFLLRIGLKLNF